MSTSTPDKSEILRKREEVVRYREEGVECRERACDEREAQMDVLAKLGELVPEDASRDDHDLREREAKLRAEVVLCEKALEKAIARRGESQARQDAIDAAKQARRRGGTEEQLEDAVKAAAKAHDEATTALAAREVEVPYYRPLA